MAAATLTVDQFVTTYQGTAWDFDGVYGAQCVDLFKFYERDVVGGSGGPVGGDGGAYNLYTSPGSTRLALYDKVSASTTARKGDVAVWSSSLPHSYGAGHVAIVLADQGSTLRVIQQNANGHPEALVGNHSKSYLLGYLRPQRFANFNTVAPSVSGSAKVGVRLTARVGSWSLSGLKFRYQWLANGSAVSGATSSAYTPSAAVAGKRISVRITASKTSYNTATATSAQTATVAQGTISNTSAPTVNGTPTVGVTVAATTGTWSPTPSSIAFQWLADGAAIGGATSASFTPGPSLAGHQLSVQVTARTAGYSDATKTSASSAVQPGDLTSTSMPVISGVAAAGSVLTATSGSWQPEPDGTTWQWLADGVPVNGATAATFTPTDDQAGALISVRQVAFKAGYQDNAVTSAAVGPVEGGDALTAGEPSVDGAASYGETLTLDPGTWGPPPVDLTYQWNRDGSPIPGATDTIYVLGEADVDTVITATVTGRKDGYLTRTVVTDPVGPVAALQFDETPTPAIAGTASLDQTLTAEVGAWSPAPDTLAYQWSRDGVAIPGADDAVYVTGRSDIDTYLTVTVTARRTGYSTVQRTSDAVGPITADRLTVGSPTVSGSAVYGQVLSLDPGQWGPAGVQLTYQWLRDGGPIAGATAATYQVDVADVGHVIAAEVSGYFPGFAPESRTSAPTTAVAATMTAPTPTITGTAKQGQTLTANTTGWTPDASFTYQWKRNGSSISGATGRTYQPGEKDIGRTLSVTVTASRPGYTTTSKTSTSTGTVTSALGDRLTAGKRLTNGQALYSPDGGHKVVQQTDGNLVVYNLKGSSPKAVWASGTNGKGAAYVEMQTDGNLVQYTSSRHAVWASGTNGKHATYLRMQNDGNLVLYTASGTAVWATGTNGK